MMTPRYLLLTSFLLASCEQSEVITETAPFQHLTCALGTSEVEAVKLKAASFAQANGFSYDIQDHDADHFAVLLANRRMNFLLASGFDAQNIYATGVARSAPTQEEAVLFTQFIKKLDVECAPASP